MFKEPVDRPCPVRRVGGLADGFLRAWSAAVAAVLVGLLPAFGARAGQVPEIWVAVAESVPDGGTKTLLQDAAEVAVKAINGSPEARAVAGVRPQEEVAAKDGISENPSGTGPSVGAAGRLQVTLSLGDVEQDGPAGLSVVLVELQDSGVDVPGRSSAEFELTEDWAASKPLGDLLAKIVLNLAMPPTVISVRSGVILVDAGAARGLTEGDRLVVHGPPRNALNLETGEFRRVDGPSLATIELVRVRGRFSEARTLKADAEVVEVGSVCRLAIPGETR